MWSKRHDRALIALQELLGRAVDLAIEEAMGSIELDSKSGQATPGQDNTEQQYGALAKEGS